MRSGFCFFIFTLSCNLLAGAWYVDSTNGSDVWDGTSAIYVTGSVGPKQTIGAAVAVAAINDTVTLLDGTYEGADNGTPAVFHALDSKHLQLMSENGADLCIIKILPEIEFSFAPSGVPATLLKGITFTADPIAQAPLYPEAVFMISGSAELHFEACVFTGFEIVPEEEFVNSTVIAIQETAKAYIDNCTFQANNMACIISSEATSYLSARSCLFENNAFTHKSSPLGLKLIHQAQDSTADILNCQFLNNQSNAAITGILFASTGPLLVKGCIFDHNTSSYHFLDQGISAWGIQAAGAGTLRILDTFISNSIHTNTSTGQFYGYGVEIPGEVPAELHRCSIANNPVGLACYSSSDLDNQVTIVDCEVFNNRTGIALAAGQTGFNGRLVIEHCTIHHNEGGVSLSGMNNGYPFSDGASLKHCLITDNTDFGMKQPDFETLFWRPQLSVENCTIANNGGIGLRVPQIKIKNTIVYGNNHGGSQIVTTPATTVHYCDVQGGWTGTGVGNFDSDPLFGDITNGDYHVMSMAGRWDPVRETWIQDAASSPCIDAGDPADSIGDEPFGCGDRINIGAYGGTAQAGKTARCVGGDDGLGKLTGDLNRDCVVNITDMAMLASQWLKSTRE